MKTSTFMRQHYLSYEDPYRYLIRINEKCKTVNDERSDKKLAFEILIKEKYPELFNQYDEVVDAFLNFENVMAEEFYVLGAEDMRQAIMLKQV